MKSKMLLFIIVSSIITSLLFQNCTKLTSFSKLGEGTVNPAGISFTTLVSQNNGEGYLGKPHPIEYVKSFENYNCVNAEIETKNIQGISIFDGQKAIVSNDNCMDVNYVIEAKDPSFDIKPYNPEIILLSGIPYEMKTTFLEDSSRATDAFCRSSMDSSGMDILVKYDEVGNSSVKIFLGDKNAEDVWNLSIVSFFSVKRSESPRIYGNEVFTLNISDSVLADGLHLAVLDMILDEKHIVKDLSCYAMNMRPTLPAVADPTMIAQWSFNNSFEEFVNNLTTLPHFFQKSFAFVKGQFGQAVFLNGVDNHIEVVANADINDLPALTISAWIKPEGGGSIVQKSKEPTLSSSTLAGWMFGVHPESNELYFTAAFDQGEMHVVTQGANIDRTIWSQVVVTWGGSNSIDSIQIYITDH